MKKSIHVFLASICISSSTVVSLARADQPLFDLGASTTMLVGVGLSLAGTSWAVLVPGGVGAGAGAAVIGTTSFLIAEAVAEKRVDPYFLKEDARNYLLNHEATSILEEAIEYVRNRARELGHEEVVSLSQEQLAYLILLTDAGLSSEPRF